MNRPQSRRRLRVVDFERSGFSLETAKLAVFFARCQCRRSRVSVAPNKIACIVPNVRSAQDARAIVVAVKYAPLGAMSSRCRYTTASFTPLKSLFR